VRNALLCAVLALTLAASGVWAQTVTVDTAMRGNTLVAAPGVAGAWSNNPAGLAALAGMESAEEPLNGWRHAASVTAEVSNNSDLVALDWGGVQIGKDFGMGAGYMDTAGGSVWGFGIGKSWPRKNISWGVNLRHVAPDGDNSNNIFDAGMLGQIPQVQIFGSTVVKYGVVLRDITDEYGRTWDAGVAFDAPQGIHVAIDLADLSDEFDRSLRVGATKEFGATNNWLVGAGFDDGDLTLGALYDSGTNWQKGSWRFGAAWQQVDGGDDSLVLGAFGNWGM
jgi:hypothetical protein